MNSFQLKLLHFQLDVWEGQIETDFVDIKTEHLEFSKVNFELDEKRLLDKDPKDPRIPRIRKVLAPIKAELSKRILKH